jgi:anti-sigma factor RsiW
VTCDDIERNLDAYVDREVEPAAAAALSEHLRGCPACRRRVTEREALSREIQSAPYYLAPDRLRARVAGQVTRRTAARRWLAWSAAAILTLAAGSGLTFLRAARGAVTFPGDAIVDEVIDGHVRSLMAEHLLDVRSSDRHTVKPWFLGRLSFSPPVADLADAGFPLIGGRLDYLSGQPVAALVYERRKHTINLFIAADTAATTEFKARSARGFHVHHWVRDGMSFWAVSDLNDAELKEFTLALRAAG